MSAPLSRALYRPRWSPAARLCDACCRTRHLSISAQVHSGHSKWASIKHDKAKKDQRVTKQRTSLTRDIVTAVQMGGPDPNSNPRLALAVTTAKKASTPKAAIESAINRGRGVSDTGAALETVVVEAVLPHSVAAIIDCQTDSKARTLVAIRDPIKKSGGNIGPVGYMFERKGVVVFKAKEGMGLEQVIDPALDAEALDVQEGEDGSVVVYTDPTATKAAAEGISAATGLEIEETDIIYDPNEDTMVALESEDAANTLGKIFDALREIQGVQGIYINAAQGKLEDDAWADLMSRVEV